MEILDSLNCSLGGTSLIEAAAGTGKTYNILNIVMRLLVEKKYPIGSIAVLSFTNEAADELKNRLRRLIDVVLAEIDGLPSDDQAKAFVDKYRRSGTEEITNIRKILRIVQRDFDDARIATINGFCHRILSENAFESGISFNAELDTMPEMKLNVLFNDWERRRRCYGKYSEILAAVELKTQWKELRGYVDDKSLEIIGGEVDIERTAEKINDALNVVFSSGAVELMERVTDYFRANCNVVTRLKTLKELLQKRKISRKLFDILKEYLPDKVSSASLKAYKEATGVLLENPFFSKCEEISNSMKELKAALYRNMLTEVAQKFEELKESGNFITYKDQIQRLKEALETDDSFCEMLRKKFNAGVVDEFQDTDAQQYAIFKKLFCGDETSERSCFFVGDPRQAIYGFRGGDLFVYLEAKRDISKNGKIYCLDKNYRSAAGMVKCVNDIFAKHPLPFGDNEQLDFPELKSRSPEDAPGLIVNGAEDPMPLRLQTLTANEDPYKVCVGRIVDLLEGRGGLLPENGGKVPTSSDIAVLVKGHHEAAIMRDLLRDAGIMAVCSKSGNIFKSEQAGELYSLLSALINPLDRTKVNTALVTKVCGVTFDELQKEDEVVGNAWGKLHSLSGIWRKRSFIAMFETMLSCFHVRERFASLPDGERGLTNLLHLGEVLQNLSVRFDFSPEALLREFAGFIADDSDVEEFQEQLYAERDAVRIMTYHASKGLEFPIVMVPNMQACQWNQHTPTYIYHKESVRQINLESLDNGSMPDAVKENRLELLRICYVVLTRAKYCCEVFYQDNVKKNFSAMDYLFRPTVIGSAVDNSIPANFREHDFCIPFLKNEICEEAVYSGKNEQYTQLVPPEKVGSIKSDWRVISYSSLTGDNSASGTELPFDRDENQDEKEREDDKKLKNLWPFNLPHGNQFGIAIHWLYEKADFTASESEFSKLVSDTFRNFRLLPGENDKEEIIAKAASWLYGVLHSPLPDSDGSSFTLSEIRQADKIAELEFNYSLGTFSAKELREALSDYVCGDELGLRAWPQNWEMELQGGVLNGFVDLLFRRNGKYYIIDWKTNCIGNRMENFFNDGLKHEMVKKLYFLQYLLYLAALIRHLRCFYGGRFGEEEYEKEIGGVYYMFVRGMSPEFAGRGVFYARPPWQTMEKLEKILCS